MQSRYFKEFFASILHNYIWKTLLTVWYVHLYRENYQFQGLGLGLGLGRLSGICHLVGPGGVEFVRKPLLGDMGDGAFFRWL